MLHPRDGEYTMAYIPARCLADAGLQENFALHADERGGVVGLDYTTAGGDCFIDVDATDTPKLVGSSNAEFRTTAQVRFYKVAAAKPKKEPKEMKAGDWACSKCGVHNYARRVD